MFIRRTVGELDFPSLKNVKRRGGCYKYVVGGEGKGEYLHVKRGSLPDCWERESRKPLKRRLGKILPQ